MRCIRRIHDPKTMWSPQGKDGFVSSLVQAYGIEEEEVSAEHSLLGKKLPIRDFEVLVGDTSSFSDLEGPVVVDLWATWCGPCVAAMPHLQELGEAYKDRGVHVVGLSLDAQQKKPEDFFKEVPAPSYTVGWIGEGGFETFDVDGIPSMFVVDKDGVIQHYIQGYSSGSDELEQVLDRLLEEDAQ